MSQPVDTLRATWPDPKTITVSGDRYHTPDGDFGRVTSILRVLGLSKEGLMKWAANLEHDAVLEAAVETWMETLHGFNCDGPADFAAAIEARLGKVRQHVKKNEAAKDIGTNVHDKIKWFHRSELGEVLPEPDLYTDEATWAWMAYHEHWQKEGGKVVRSEQPVWDSLGYAGTIDLLVEFAHGLEVWDFKSSKSIYDEHHAQVAAYCHAARNWAPVVGARIIHLPKTTEQTQVEVVRLGDLNPVWGSKQRRQRTEEELMEVFRGALMVWKGLVE